MATVQLFSDKSKFFLRAGALSFMFHPIFIKALDFLLKSCLVQIIENRMMVPYLPVSYHSTKFDDGFPNLSPFRKNYGDVELPQSLHEGTECALEKLLFTAFSGFTAALLIAICILYTLRRHLTFQIFPRWNIWSS